MSSLDRRCPVCASAPGTSCYEGARKLVVPHDERRPMTGEERVGQLVRSRHPYAFRSGAWARIVAVWQPADGRAVWLVSWPDEVTDTWVVDDPVAEYEFAA